MRKNAVFNELLVGEIPPMRVDFVYFIVYMYISLIHCVILKGIQILFCRVLHVGSFHFSNCKQNTVVKTRVLKVFVEASAATDGAYILKLNQN